jgi:hypothetical protein
MTKQKQPGILPAAEAKRLSIERCLELDAEAFQVAEKLLPQIEVLIRSGLIRRCVLLSGDTIRELRDPRVARAMKRLLNEAGYHMEPRGEFFVDQWVVDW